MDEHRLQSAETPDENPVIAWYTTHPLAWVDVREAKPRCRIRAVEGSPMQRVAVLADGRLLAPDAVEVDLYDDYPTVQAEEVL